MSDISREEALAHFGVKGMRWGIRNDSTTTPAPKVGRSDLDDIEAAARKAARGRKIAAGVLLTAGYLTINTMIAASAYNSNTPGSALNEPEDMRVPRGGGSGSGGSW